MSIKVSEVRTAIAAQVATISGFKELPFPGEYLGRVQNSIAHKGFGVSIDTSNSAEDRQARRTPYYLQSNVIVKFSYRLRPHDLILDYGAALDAEQEVITACLGSYTTIKPGLQIRFQRAVRNFTDSLEYIIIQIEFLTYHHIN